MGLFGLFKSKLEKESVGKKISCADCGSVYYEIKILPFPSELSHKYDYEPGTQCAACGKFYCRSCSWTMMMPSCCGLSSDRYPRDGDRVVAQLPLRCVKKIK